MKQLTVLKLSALFISFVLILAMLPNQSYAEGNVFDCIENDKNCDDDKTTPIVDDKPNTNTSEQAVSLTAWDYIKTILALVFVVGLLFGLLKFINRKNRMYDKSRFMKNMGGISLGQHKSVQLVVVGEAYYLIGVGEDIRLLKEITDKEEIERLTDFYEDVDINSTTGWLDRLFEKKKKPTESTEKDSNFSNIFNTRLDEMKEERNRHIRQLTEKERDKDE